MIFVRLSVAYSGLKSVCTLVLATGGLLIPQSYDVTHMCAERNRLFMKLGNL